MQNFDAKAFLMSMGALVICITIHEFSHAYSAWRAGDDTPRRQGRISLNPIDHLDPFGTIMMVASSIAHFGIGWGKAVQINPYNFRHPRWDNLRTSLWGPLSNILTAAVVGTAVRFWYRAMIQNPHSQSQFAQNSFEFLYYLTGISVALAVFNLLPLAPLDGSHILSSLLPYELARSYDGFMGRYGMMIFLVLVLASPQLLPAVLGPPRRFLFHLFTGFHW